MLALALLPAARAAGAAEPAVKAISYEKDVTPLLQKYCYECHGDGMDKAGLPLDSYVNAGDVRLV